MSELAENFQKLMDLYVDIKNEVRGRDKYLYERWKAGGFCIDDDIMSMYPSLSKIIDSVDYEEETEEE